ncbi:hypothetical protein B0T10DRAFT_607228 [Thelonectria olida]|uniref:Uncharacterized protein n=1 Tax=Thelonectria olida TaxID=1576542 RepID=A0A9P8W2Y0_9HYPO|nr:hypothetical protein B0T10DRAFT_607228 [Thelonectria olida]
MTDLTTNYVIRAWEQNGSQSHQLEATFLRSPCEFAAEPQSSLVLQQTDLEPQNTVWTQNYASMPSSQTDQFPDKILMDEAHAVILRDGESWTLPQDDEDETVCKYNRGDRVWVSDEVETGRRIDETAKNIPVINVDTYTTFEISYDYLCFIPRLRKNSGSLHGACVSPDRRISCGEVTTIARLYVKWLAAKPEQVTFVWLSGHWTKPGQAKQKDSLLEWGDKGDIFEAFREQWHSLTSTLADRGLLFGDEDISYPSQCLESISDVEEEDLTVTWGTPPTAKWCNLDPCPAFKNPDLDLVASFIGGYEFTEHYHVQDDDLHECPRGAVHKNHCVLRDSGTRCAYVTDRVKHTCCRLRMNPILPGPHADPYDPTVPLWETTAGDEHFLDASSNVRTRTQLEDRDEIPPELEQALQQILSKEKVAQQSDSVSTFGGLRTKGARFSHADFMAMNASQTEHSPPHSWQTHRGQFTKSNCASRVFEGNAHSSSHSPDQRIAGTFDEPSACNPRAFVDTQYATSVASDSNDHGYHGYCNALNAGSFQAIRNRA